MRIILITLLAIFVNACAGVGVNPGKNGEPLSVSSGQKIYVEVFTINGAISDVKQVDENTNPDITMIFNFTNPERGMMLSVKNPTEVSVKYNIDMIDFEGKAHQTSSCPVMAGSSVFESWPHPIPEILVKNFHALQLSSTMSCVY